MWDRTDAQGQVIARHDFLPFGEELAPQNPPVDERLFTGQVRDFGTGLGYFHARQLRVDLGRFTTPDPLADLAWTDPTLGASNAYGYVQSNPLGFVDPMGAQGDQIVVHPSWWDRFVGWLAGSPVFRSGVTVCISCNSSPGPSSLVGGITGGAGTIGPGPGEPGRGPETTDQSKKTTNCPPVPEAPAGADLDSNIGLAKRMAVATYIDPGLSLPLFYFAVGNGGLWDYKQAGSALRTVTPTGKLTQNPYEDFGNFNYGAVGAAWGIPLEVLRRAAGFAQGRSGNDRPQFGKWYGSAPYGDDPADAVQIAAGWDYYQMGCYAK